MFFFRFAFRLFVASVLHDFDDARINELLLIPLLGLLGFTFTFAFVFGLLVFRVTATTNRLFEFRT